MAIRIKIIEGAMNHPQTTSPGIRQTVDVSGDPDRTKLAEDESLDEKRKKKKRNERKRRKRRKVKKIAVIVLPKGSMTYFPPHMPPALL